MSLAAPPALNVRQEALLRSVRHRTRHSGTFDQAYLVGPATPFTMSTARMLERAGLLMLRNTASRVRTLGYQHGNGMPPRRAGQHWARLTDAGRETAAQLEFLDALSGHAFVLCRVHGPSVVSAGIPVVIDYNRLACVICMRPKRVPSGLRLRPVTRSERRAAEQVALLRAVAAARGITDLITD